MTEKDQNCPLCLTDKAELHFETGEMSYYRCNKCDFIFVPKNQHLSIEEEKKRYDLHENDPENKGYQAFLNQLLKPLISKLKTGSKGLDYGSGPGPGISKMLKEKKFNVENYDPIYSDSSELLEKSYDFITCTEVVEHFRNPIDDWKQLTGLLKPNGLLGIMTNLTDDCTDFKNWHYRRDDTHISFYSKKTIIWIADKFNLEASFPSKRVILLQAN